ncbi:MAG: hypothetical protein HY298_25950 [Verrucomicrobia bacterium]|nr:hypothetical protein [Verrucomicrobiota bacterium]
MKATLRPHIRQLTAMLFALLAMSASATVHYVDANNASPVPPYIDWATAATTIQDAIDIALPQDEIVVTNGIYASGGRVAYGSLTNRVAIIKPLNVRSVNGPGATVVEGYQVPGSINGDSAIRCLYLTNGAQLIGFTLRKGATRTSRTFTDPSTSGGGVFGEKYGLCIVSNCLLTGNSARDYGGGAAGARLYNCVVSNNTSGLFGGGVLTPACLNCTLISNSAQFGGGAYEGYLTNCVLSGNKASQDGAGANGSILYNCVIRDNIANNNGGGVYAGAVYNCTIVGNSASQGGGLHNTFPARNSIMYYNNSGGNYYNSGYANCCTIPLIIDDDVRSFTNAPMFVNLLSGDFRLQSNSPCINSGYNASAPAGVDLDGNPRVVGGYVDVGAYEYQNPSSVISLAYLQRYGLPTDGLADYMDSDGDGMNNWQEWQAGTNPTNAQSVLHLLSPMVSGSGVVLKWAGIRGITYSLQRSTNLTNQTPFLNLRTNIPGPSVSGYTNTFTDTNVTFVWALYRLGVQE